MTARTQTHSKANAESKQAGGVEELSSWRKTKRIGEIKMQRQVDPESRTAVGEEERRKVMRRGWSVVGGGGSVEGSEGQKVRGGDRVGGTSRAWKAFVPQQYWGEWCNF